MNDLFDGELTDDDKLVYVNNVITRKLLGVSSPGATGSSNTKEQFSDSPDLGTDLLNAIMDALTAHSAVSKQAFGL